MDALDRAVAEALAVAAEKRVDRIEARRIREAAGLTQEQMAALAGVPLYEFGRWERGFCKPAPENARRWRAALARVKAATEREAAQ
jgi:transcriptional regulator with XRE-family HTH domain